MYPSELGQVLDEAGSTFGEEPEVGEDEGLVRIESAGDLDLLAGLRLSAGRRIYNVFGAAASQISHL